jgi:hypothetical protein
MRLAGGNTVLRAGMLGVLAAMGVVGVARAQALPPHSVSYDLAAARCTIALAPDATTGEAPPQLHFSVNMLTDRIAMGLEAADAVESVLVFAGSRTPFFGFSDVTYPQLAEQPVWTTLVAAEQSGEAVFFTVKDLRGNYSSARYDALLPKDILRLAAISCGAQELPAPPETEIEFRRAEASLVLPAQDMRRIRRILAVLYGEAGVDPGTGTELTVTDRRYLQAYNTEKGLAAGGYLTAASAEDLLSREVVPRQPPLPPNEDLVEAIRDWKVLRRSTDGACSAVTAAVGATGLVATEAPYMGFRVYPGQTGGLLEFDLIRPNPFARGATIVASVDGASFDLMYEPNSGSIVPKPLSDGLLSNELTVSMRRGKAVSLRGEAASGEGDVAVEFSALGFAAAFRKMAEVCDRGGVMGWIE